MSEHRCMQERALESAPPIEEQRAELANPQATPSVADLAYLAGIIDGEGSFGISRMDCAKAPGFKLFTYLCIANTTPGIINACQRIMSEIGVNVWLQDKGCNTNKGIQGRKNVWEIRIGAFGKIRAVLQACRPYLYGKGAEADILLRYIAHRESRGVGRGNKLDETDLEFHRMLKWRKSPETVRDASGQVVYG